jgi:hypothetical protein
LSALKKPRRAPNALLHEGLRSDRRHSREPFDGGE